MRVKSGSGLCSSFHASVAFSSAMASTVTNRGYQNESLRVRQMNRVDYVPQLVAVTPLRVRGLNALLTRSSRDWSLDL